MRRRAQSGKRPAIRGARSSLGQSFAELAIILPVFLVIVLIGLDFGRAFMLGTILVMVPTLVLMALAVSWFPALSAWFLPTS